MRVGRKWPGSAPGHEWKKPGDVVEVDDGLGQELVAIPNGGFYEVVPTAEADQDDSPKPKPEHGKADDETPATDGADAEPDEAPEEPKRRPGRPRKPKPEAEISE